LKKKTKRISI